MLLLTTLEGFPPHEAAKITGHSEAEIAALLREAVAEIDRQTATRVLIIEDEPLISLDLSEIVESLGHTVSPPSRAPPTRRWRRRASVRPGLVLADIQLADGSSGLDAVRDILSHFSGAGDLRHVLPGAAADRAAAGADVPDHQALRSERGEGGDQPGAVLPHRRLGRGLSNDEARPLRAGLRRGQLRVSQSSTSRSASSLDLP